MSVYKRPEAETWSFDFWLDGRRFSGTTGATTRREALRVQDREREAAREELRRTKPGARAPMTFEEAASLYWTEVGQHHKGADNTLWSLAWLKREIGAARRIVDIDDRLVAELVARRRGEHSRSGQNRRKRGKHRKPAAPAQLVAPATVNRSVTQPLRKILNRAKRTWKEPVSEIAWKDHMLREPKERVRELKAEEEARLFAALRPDFHAIARFVLLTGLRLDEVWKLRWQDVDWGGRRIAVHGKGDKPATIPLAPAVREVLWPLREHHETFVFTYVAARSRGRRKRGERQPMTRSHLQSTVRRVLEASEIPNFSFHDTRHTAATRILRETGNLRLVQRLLRHEDIATTTKYAHVTDDDVMAGMQAAAERAEAAQAALATQSPTESPTEPRAAANN